MKRSRLPHRHCHTDLSVAIAGLLSMQSRIGSRGAAGLVMAALAAGVCLPSWAQSVDAASCASAPLPVPAGQVRADGTLQVVGAGERHAPTTGSAFFALNGGTIRSAGAVSLITTGANTATACASNNGTIDFLDGGTHVSRLGAGGPALRAESGATITSLATQFYTSQANSEGIQLVGARFSGNGDLIATGVVLGTDASIQSTYGLPIDAGGNPVSDPSLFRGKAATAAHGISASASQVRLNLDGTGNPTGSATSIYILGTGANAVNGSHGLNALDGAIFTVDSVQIVTRGNNNFGARIAGTSRLDASRLSIDTTGTGATGVAFVDSAGTLANLGINTTGITAHGLTATGTSTVAVDGVAVRVAGQNANGVQAVAGGSVTLSGAGSTVITSGQTGNALRADGANSSLRADGLRLSTLANGGIGAHALNNGSVDVRDSAIYSSGINGGNAAVGLSASLGGTTVSRGNTIVTGVVLGTDPSLPTYGLPVDAAGNAVTDPAAFVPSGTTGANGAQVAVTGGFLWLDVDPAGAAQTSSTAIRTYGNNSSGVVVGQSATATSRLQAARTSITTYGTSSNAVLIQGTAGASGAQASLSQMDIRTQGQHSNAIYGQAGAQVTVSDSSLMTSGTGAGIRADGAATRVTARNLTIGAGGLGGSGLNATGGTIDSANTRIVNSGRPGMTLNAGGGTPGTLISSADTVYTGVLLGTNVDLPTFGKPVDGAGNAISDPAAFVASGLAGHGVFAGAPGGRVWMNVDPLTGAPTGTRNSITTLGDTSEGFNIQGVDSLATLANVTVSTRGVDSIGARAAASGEIRASDLTVRTSGFHGYGLAAYADSLVTAAGSDVVTSGEEAYGLIAWANNGRVVVNAQSSVQTSGEQAHAAIAWNGGRVEVNATNLSATGANASALFVRGDPAAASASVTDGTLSSAAGATVGAVGSADIALTNATVNSAHTWLMAGAASDFDAFDAAVPQLPPANDPGGPAPESSPEPVLGPATVSPMAVPLADVPTVATVTATNSDITGAAVTLPGSVAHLVLQDSRWNLTDDSNLTSLVNDPSTISFAPPTGDPTLLASYKTLTVGSYAGDGTLAMNTYIGGDDSPSDRLVIDAGSGTGPSQVLINRTAGNGDLTIANGIEIVSAINGATTTADAFRLGARVVGGPYEYTLQRGSRDASAPQSWYLRSTIDCNAPAAPSPPCPAPPDPPAPPSPPPPTPPPGPPPIPPPEPPEPTPPIPNYRPEVSLYAALAPTALHYGRSLIDTLHERVGEQEVLRGRQDLDGTRSIDGAWGRLMYVNGKSEGDDAGIYGAGPSYDYVFGAIQRGWDLYRREDPDATRTHAGLYGAIGYAETQVDHFDDAPAGDDRVDGYTLGGYWTRYSAREAYLDAVVQATWYEASATAGLGLERMETEGWGFAGSVEGGYPFAAGRGWIIEPQAQLIYSWLDLDDTSDLGATVRFDDTESLVGRLSGKFSRAWTHDEHLEEKLHTTAWVRLSAWYEFMGDPITGFSSQAGVIPFHADMGGGWGEIELGATREIDRNFFFYGNVGYSRGFDDDRSAWEGKIGLRADW